MSTSSQAYTVAVTGPHKRFPVGWWATRFCLSLCNIRSIYVTPQSPPLTQPVHGVVIGGGDDIEPEHYGSIKTPSRNYDPERDNLEMDIIRQALTANAPLLGICRGAQLINVVQGGTLFDDIRPLRQHTSNRLHIRPIKWVNLEAGSQLQKLLKATTVKVNSLHNQAINQIGSELRIIGKDQDEFIQAIEGLSGFVLGVQWHPEYLPYKYHQRRLFQHFGNAVREFEKELVLKPLT